MKKKNLLKSGLRFGISFSGIIMLMIFCISSALAQHSLEIDLRTELGLEPGEQNITPGGQSGSRASDYIWDDGVTNSNVAIGTGGDQMWLIPFTVIPGAEYIHTISLTWGSAAIPGFGPPPGTPARVILYEDPNDDGDPSDAVYLTEAATVVANVDSDIFNTVSIPSTMVSGVFFVAALMQNTPVPLPSPPGYFTAALDSDYPTGINWWVGEDVTPGTFDVITLTNNSLPPFLSSFPGTWMLRAYGTSSPFPPVVPLASIWIVIAAVGMGGAAFFKFRRK